MLAEKWALAPSRPPGRQGHCNLQFRGSFLGRGMGPALLLCLQVINLALKLLPQLLLLTERGTCVVVSDVESPAWSGRVSSNWFGRCSTGKVPDGPSVVLGNDLVIQFALMNAPRPWLTMTVLYHVTNTSQTK